MLTFSKTDTGNFVITEKIHGWSKTETKTVEFSSDLTQKRCNTDPFRPTNEEDRAWFNKHYISKFDAS